MTSHGYTSCWLRAGQGHPVRERFPQMQPGRGTARRRAASSRPVPADASRREAARAWAASSRTWIALHPRPDSRLAEVATRSASTLGASTLDVSSRTEGRGSAPAAPVESSPATRHGPVARHSTRSASLGSMLRARAVGTMQARRHTAPTTTM